MYISVQDANTNAEHESVNSFVLLKTLKDGEIFVSIRGISRGVLFTIFHILQNKELREKKWRIKECKILEKNSVSKICIRLFF